MDKPLSPIYRASYAASTAIATEHRLDADAILRTLQALPGWWQHLTATVHRQGNLTLVDAGSGEAAKSLAVARGLLDVLDVDKLTLHAVEPDPEHRKDLGGVAAASFGMTGGRVRTELWAQTMESFLDDVAVGRIRLDPPPMLVMCLHVLYYLAQEDGPAGRPTIPLLARLAEALDPDGLLVLIGEGPGDLQDLKWWLHTERGLTRPPGRQVVLDTLTAAGLPFAGPVVVPNTWPVGFDGPPGVMFRDRMGFLTRDNHLTPGTRPPRPADDVAAGRWVRDRALVRRNAELWGPDDLVVAGRWLADHPDDRRAMAADGSDLAAV